jgi:hypothetical protein
VPESGEERAVDEIVRATRTASAPGFFAPAPVLIYLTLKSPRLKDRADIVELIKAGIDVEETRQYLGHHAPRFLESSEPAFGRP